MASNFPQSWGRPVSGPGGRRAVRADGVHPARQRATPAGGSGTRPNGTRHGRPGAPRRTPHGPEGEPAVNYAEFREAVAKRAGLPPPEADNIVRATLTTLTERISGGEADDLAAQLPEELREHMHKDVDFGERLDLAEFLNEVRARAGVDRQRAAEGIRAVLTTLRDAVSAEEFKDMASELPKDIQQLLYPVSRQVGA
ncbi:DUF2267 domain-containing protein [Micromonospora globispora]|uniref:DUF2267 domain-containing protein n=1 Tax=Micromonospora globispora TaxID=1450148 RepID=A0A317K9R7_9ACTN|nr:DUF2267 domain-containing protein [Micromonospora globispora]PWU62082.1 DUF2267 domain-containing protein [Micromonospora globispora]RQW94476.1 DUF2267 domain-containing protein [Micromonospora globispora]